MKVQLFVVCFIALFAVSLAQEQFAGLEQVPQAVRQVLQRVKKTHHVQLPPETMKAQYAAPVINRHVKEVPILQRTNIKQPIVQPRLVETATIRHRVRKQPVIRRIITQPVVQPRVIQSTEVQPRIYEQVVNQPHVYQQEVVQQELREEQQMQQAKRHAPRIEQQKRFGKYAQLWSQAGAGPMHPEMPALPAGHNERLMSGSLEALQESPKAEAKEGGK